MEWKNETKQTGAENEFDPLSYIIQHIERLISPIVDKDRQRNRQHDKNEEQQDGHVDGRLLHLHRRVLQNVPQNGAVTATAIVRVASHFRQLPPAMEARALRHHHYHSITLECLRM